MSRSLCLKITLIAFALLLGLIDFHYTALHVYHPEAVHSCLEQGPVPFLALLQRIPMGATGLN